MAAARNLASGMAPRVWMLLLPRPRSVRRDEVEARSARASDLPPEREMRFPTRRGVWSVELDAAPIATALHAH